MSGPTDNEWDFSFIWKIENFLSCDKEFGEEILSPVFTVESLDRSKWYLSFYPKGDSEKYRNHVACFLNRVDDGGMSREKIRISFEIELAAGESLTKDGYENPPFLTQDKCGWINIIPSDEIMNKMKTCAQDTLTVCCRIKNMSLDRKSYESCEARTKIVVDQYSFKWNVRFLKNALKENKKYFFLKTQIYRISISMQQDYAEIIIRKMEGKSTFSQKVTGKITVLNMKGNEVISRRDTHLFALQTNDELWEFPSFISKKLIQDVKPICVQDYVFDIFCDFSLTDESDIRSPYETFSTVDAICELRRDWTELWSSEKFSDVKLRVSNSIFPAHKCLLAVRSPVFATMFDQDMIENQTGIVDIPDVETETLKSFLEYLYTGSVTDLDYEMSWKLLVLADKYQVDSLKEKCALFLMSELSTNNVGDTLFVADMVHHAYLKSFVLDYIVKHADEILSSSEWSEWINKNPRFSAEIFSYIGKNL